MNSLRTHLTRIGWWSLGIAMTMTSHVTAFASDSASDAAAAAPDLAGETSGGGDATTAPVTEVSELPPGDGIRINTDFKPINSPDAMNQNYGIDTVNSFIQFIAGSIIEIVGGVAIFMFVIAGYMFVTAGGDQGRIDKAKEIIKYTIFGLIIIIFSFAIVRGVIQLILEVDKF